jgi:hypothetical protein
MSDNTCKNKKQIGDLGGYVYENLDGSVYVYVLNEIETLAPQPLTKECCLYLDPNYFFDIDKQKCLWALKKDCSIQNAFKISLNPNGNDGVIFNKKSENHDCILEVEFDYLIKVKCETLSDLLNNGSDNSILVDNIFNNDILNIEIDIEKQNVICENLTNQIELIKEEISNTPYSIYCDDSITNKQIIASLPNSSLDSFSKTSFKSKSVDTNNTIASIQTASPSGTLYCLSDNGLASWAIILGSIRYQHFLNGDSTSYSCTDVNAIKTLNDTAKDLITVCNVSFGTKTDLINSLNILLSQQIDCENKLQTLNNQLTTLKNSTQNNILNNCAKPINLFESLDLSMTIDYLDSSTYITAYESNDLFPNIGNGLLYSYLTKNINSGFYVCGDTDCTPFNLNLTGIEKDNSIYCSNIINSILDDLFIESNLDNYQDFSNTIPNSAFTSNWLHYKKTITDPTIISKILNKKIKLGIKVNHTCSDICILIDNIRLDRICTTTSNTNYFITESPGFKLERVKDNKKSWVSSSLPLNRNFTINNYDNSKKIRQTNYNLDDEKLVINTKEIDLDISLASAIETDVWNYIINNKCLLTGTTNCNLCDYKQFQNDSYFEFQDGQTYEFMSNGLINDGSTCCGDNLIMFDKLLTQPLSAITTTEDFEEFISSELIDVKNRKTISSYPTIKALYDRYLNSELYCNTKSSKFNYLTIDKFSSLIDNYWVDLIEQVVPSTTIWGSTKIYSNTIFDSQKFKYKSYTTFFETNPLINEIVLSPINGINGNSKSLDIETFIVKQNKNNKITISPSNRFDKIFICQMNYGCEFIGTINISD